MEIDGRLRRARTLLEVGRTDRASELAAAIVADDPADADALCLLAECLSRLGDHESMLAAADRAVAADPDCEHAHRLRALALVRAERGKEAAEAAREAVRLAPDTWQGQIALAIALIGEPGQRKAAFAACKLAIALAPDNAEPHYIQGILRQAKGNTIGAQLSYRHALRIDPQHSGALENLGRIHMRADRPVSALRHFRAAAAADPTGVAGMDHAERVMFGALNLTMLSVLISAIVLMFGTFVAAWPIAAAAVVAVGGWWLWRAWRALPPALQPVALDWLRSRPRFAVRVWMTGVFLLVALGCGIGSAALLPRHGAMPPRPAVTIFSAPFASLLVGVVVIKIVEWRAARRPGRPSAPIDQADPSAQTGWTKLVQFWLYRAAVLAFVVVFIPAIEPDTVGWGERALIGLPAFAALVAYGRYVLRRRSNPLGELWQRFPEYGSRLCAVGALVCGGYVLLFAISPSSGVLDDAVAVPIVAVMFFVPLQLWWTIFRVVRRVRGSA
ncbi:tetratricopeptide repeat protein [Actinomadura barringtoniae]|uniref:Tetratricopeptide repeat protein n=1 Tax=Actinomadura barringtoniae TaxID=1427535 RepID=A0A939PG50_9ACTN|nr:tetratricopeptide repeat protein [Actinomadura barringtoniae]MBO2449129.1 tetratricopeptide repeat protein [Actinomadura barringtoniae]